MSVIPEIGIITCEHEPTSFAFILFFVWRHIEYSNFSSNSLVQHAGRCLILLNYSLYRWNMFPEFRKNQFFKALPGNEGLDTVIIIQLYIKLPLLAAWHTSFAWPKQVSRKRHPTMPALQAPLCCSPVAGRQKLADAQTGLVSCFTTQRHRMGNSTLAYTYAGRRYSDDPLLMQRNLASLNKLSEKRWPPSLELAHFHVRWKDREKGKWHNSRGRVPAALPCRFRNIGSKHLSHRAGRPDHCTCRRHDYGRDVYCW